MSPKTEGKKESIESCKLEPKRSMWKLWFAT